LTLKLLNKKIKNKEKFHVRMSVLIPTYNGAKQLTECIDSIVSQKTGFKWELILVDDGSTDETTCLIKGYVDLFPYGVKYCKLKHSGPSTARNAGIKISSGEVLLFLDNDVRLPPNFLERVSKSMDETGVAILGLLDLPFEEDSYMSKAARHIENFSRLRSDPKRATKSAAIAYRREVFDQAGLYDEGRLYYQAEDTEHVLRSSQAGFPVAFLKEPFLWHRSSGLKDNLRKSFLSLRTMDAPDPIIYYRIKYGLLGIMLSIIFLFCLYFARVPSLFAIIFVCLVSVGVACYISWTMSGSLLYMPGIILSGILRILLIMYGSLRYLWIRNHMAYRK